MRWLLGLVLALLASPALPFTVTGTVNGPDGKPLAGAEVLATSPYYTGGLQPEHRTATATTGADGGFSCALEVRSEDYPQALVIVRAPGLALGFADVRAKEETVEIRMEAPVPHEGRVTDSKGGPREGVRVTVNSIDVQRRSNAGTSGMSHTLPQDLLPELTTTTDTEGRYRFACLGNEPSAMLAFEGDSFGRAALWVSAGWDARIPDAGRLTVRITGDEVAKLAGSWALCAGQLAGEGGGLSAHAATRLGADGLFEAGLLPAGSYIITVYGTTVDAPKVRDRTVTVVADETTEIEIALEAMATVRGRIVSAVDGQGLEGLRLGLRSVERDAEGLVMRLGEAASGTSAADGSFALRCLPGTHELTVSPRPDTGPPPAEEWDPYRSPTPFEVTMEGIDLGEVALRRCYTLPVRVVDASGAPVPGVEVALETTVNNVRHSFSTGSTSSADGMIYCRFLDGLHTVSRAREVEVGPGLEPFTLAVATAELCTATVRVVDRDGVPLEGLEVMAEWTEETRGTTAHNLDRAGRTDRNGRCTAERLKPGIAYSLSVCERGTGYTETAGWTATPGPAHDFGDLVLPRPKGTIEGTVQDAEGIPVPYAAVTAIDSGVEVKTEADGRFVLPRAAARSQVVVVEAEGYALEGIVCAPGAPVAVVLQPAQAATIGAPVPCAAPLSPPAAALEQVSARAASDLARLATATDEASALRKEALLELLGRIAPDTGFAIAAEQGASDAPAKRGLALAHLEDDTDEALALLRDAGAPGVTAPPLLRAAERLLRARPEIARACLSTALDLVRSQATRSPQDLVEMARLGELLLRAGDPRGETVLREAAAEAETLGSDYHSVRGRQRVGVHVCALEPELGLTLLTGTSGTGPVPLCLGRALDRIARKDTSAAAQLADDRGAMLVGDDKRAAVAPYLWRADPAAARALIEGRLGPDEPSLALGRVACVAEGDERCRLLEEAAGPPDRRVRGMTRAIEAECAARIACLARRLGYSQPRQLALRALLRWARRAPTHSADWSLGRVAGLAEALAPVAPDTVRALVECELAVCGGSAYPTTWVELLHAAAACDPAWALELLERHGGQITARSELHRIDAYQAIGAALATTPETREWELLAEQPADQSNLNANAQDGELGLLVEE